jgi:methionyl aminopeptidase
MLYSDIEIEILREGGKRLSSILKQVADFVDVGVVVSDINTFAEKLIRDGGDTPAFLNYKPEGASKPYPASLCVSINDEVVHGIPKDRIVKDGDIVGLDLGLIHNKLVLDMAITVPIGNINKDDARLISATKESLMAGIDAARNGGHIGDIGYAIEKTAKKFGFNIVDGLGGHGVGREVHEEPYIPNVGQKGTGEKIKTGMVLALEPMLSAGSKNVFLDKNDGYTFKIQDGSKSAHFEHTILITDGKAEILTK